MDDNDNIGVHDSTGSVDGDPVVKSKKKVERDSNIQVYCRVRPTRRKSRYLKVTPNDGVINVMLPVNNGNYLQNMREEYEFQFSGIFDEHATQDMVFESIGRKVLTSVLDGYNGTIFAYGQTGSGKTYTITGGAEKYEQRGLIPRTLTALFHEIERQANDVKYTVHISYLEIYNNRGYDLLDPDHDTKQLEQLRRVTLLEDEDGNVRMRNLGMLPVRNEEDALNLLFVGDTNRIICETPMNDASSRSHCIFTINIEAQSVGSSLIRKSKLHLVDLAGSERVKKTKVSGRILQEAQAINTSLLFLQQVIVALHERSKGRDVTHVPYRNSMMTSVLRDSLGGNCLTVMVATMSSEELSLDETVSTCRFAANVAMIKNTAAVNQQIDPTQLIKTLKGEVRDLREKVAVLQGDEIEEQELSEEDRERCRELVYKFVRDEATIELVNPQKLRECLNVMKHMIVSSDDTSGAPTIEKRHRGDASTNELTANGDDAMHRLRVELQSRDNEIKILVSMLKQQGKVVDMSAIQAQAASWSASPNAVSSLPSSTATLADRTQAFDVFRRSYRKYAIIEEQKATLKEKYTLAKQLGESVNASRNEINRLKAAIERHRLELGLQSLVPGQESLDCDEKDEELRQAMEHEKGKYRNTFTQLKALKSEIEHMQHMLESSRKHLQADFEAWWKRTSANNNNNNNNNHVTRREESQNTQRANTVELQSSISAPHVKAAPAVTRLTASDVVASSTSTSVLTHQPAAAPSLQPQCTPVPVVTGNEKADADIAAFYKLRQQMLGR